MAIPCTKCIDAFVEIEKKRTQELKKLKQLQQEVKDLEREYEALSADHADELDELMDDLFERKTSSLTFDVRKSFRKLAYKWRQSIAKKRYK